MHQCAPKGWGGSNNAPSLANSDPVMSRTGILGPHFVISSIVEESEIALCY